MMNIHPQSLIFIFGASQALLLIIGINYKKALSSSLQSVISLLLLAIGFAMLYYILLLNEVMDQVPLLSYVGLAAWMAIAPLYYIVSEILHDPKWKLRWIHLIYFPFTISYLLEGIAVHFGWPGFYHLLQNPQLYLDLWMLAFFSTGIYFFWKSVQVLKRRRQANQNRSLLVYSRIFLGTLLLFALVYLTIREAYFVLFELILIGLLELFVFILIFRIFKSFSFKHAFELPTYDNQALSPSQLQKYARKIEQVMQEEQPFLNKKLSLNDLAKLSGINPNTLSQLFSSHYHSNFYDFINDYRISYLEKRILEPNAQQFTISALAEESGFNSKATFYKVFKKKHKLTPSAFIKKHKISTGQVG